MEILFRPWRITYLQQEKDKECILCKKRDSNDDEENMMLIRGEYSFALMNIFPYNIGHLMVAPFRHGISFEELSMEEIQEISLLVKRLVTAIKNSLSPEGFNLGINIGKAAGAGIEDHLHIHIIPRWVGDTNFMTSISDTRVLGEALVDTYHRIKGAL